MADKVEQFSDAILRRPKVERKTGLKRATLYRRMAAGTFPKACDLGGGVVGWLESEMQEWIRSKAKAHQQATV